MTSTPHRRTPAGRIRIVSLSVPVILLFMLLPAQTASAAQTAPADREIIPLGEGVHQFRDGKHYSVFMVTGEGVIMTDPLNASAAGWLRREVEERFGKPIRYVIYSHNHSDHIYGGDAFDGPGVTFVSHRLAREDLVFTGAGTRIPDVTFEDRMTIELGGRRVELRYHGPTDGRGSISMLFLPARVLFVADWVVLGRMPWKKLWSYDVRGTIAANRQLEALDFSLIATGHSRAGPREQLVAHRRYLEALEAAVLERIRRGESLEEMQKSIRLDEFSHLEHYEEWLPLNIEGVWKELMNRSGMSWRP